MRTLYLIDATSQLYRAYFALPALTNDAGVPTHAVYGFTTMLRKLLKDEAPSYVAAAFDKGRAVFRHETYADYKANRPPTPEDLSVQVPYAKQVCEILGVRILELDGYEADDIIATMARRARDDGFDVVVVAADKDLMQLVGQGISLLNPVKNLRLDAAGVGKQFGAPPASVRDVLGLMGDTVDNIPGVPGVGEKTALALVSTYGSLDEVLARATRFVALFDARERLLAALLALERACGDAAAAVDELLAAVAPFRVALDAMVDDEADDAARARLENVRRALDEAPLPRPDRVGAAGKELAKGLKGLRRELKGMERGSAKRVWYAIHEHADRAQMSRQLATLDDVVPVAELPDQLALAEPDAARARELFGALGFRSLLPEFREPTGVGAPPTTKTSDRELLTVTSLTGLRPWLRQVQEAGRLVITVATEGGDPLRARWLGLALAWRPGLGLWLPLRGGDDEAPPDALSSERLGEALAVLFADPAVAKLAHDSKRVLHVLRRHGLAVAGWTLDTLVAAFLLDSDRRGYELAGLSETYLGQRTGPAAGSTPRLPLQGWADDEASWAGQAEDTLRLAEVLAGALDDAGLRRLYDEIDGPLLPLLAEMEQTGIRVDTELLHEMSIRMGRELESLAAEIHELAGTEFNVDSPKQLREVLFERLGLKPRRKTAKSKVASTDAQTLEELASDHAIARKLLDYRERAKLKGTYVDALPRLVHPTTRRVHTSYHPAGAATGRLSSSDPNLQNIPVRSEAGREIRGAFVPEDGFVFLASDYSQVELRVMAHLAEDEELTVAFRANEDIHRYTASRVFGVARDDVTAAMRRRAKAVNFGIIYGMSETRLAREQGLTRGEARRFIQTYFERFAGVRRYIDAVREQARRDGTVRTLFGRVRRFPQLHQRANRAVVEQALRAAVNTTIQGTAADLMKLAMLRVRERLADDRLAARLLLQVHDELLLEVPAGQVEATRRCVRAAMEGVAQLTVPLAVDQKVGRSWLEVT